MALFDRMRNMTPEKKKKWANALFLLGGGLQDKDITQQAMMLQQMNAMNKAEADAAEFEKDLIKQGVNPGFARMIARNPQATKAYIDNIYSGTGAKDTADIRNYQFRKNLNPEEQQAWDAMQNQDPLTLFLLEEQKRKGKSAGGLDLTPLQKKIDETFATTATDYITKGRPQIKANLQNLANKIDVLKAGQVNVSGPEMAFIPEKLAPILAKDAVAFEDDVRDIVFQSLREKLGAQFTEKEGDRLVAAAFNKNLSEEVNIARLQRLSNTIQEAAQSKEEAIIYYNKNKTLQGYESKPLDFNALLNNVVDGSDYEGLSDEQLLKIADENPDELDEIIKYVKVVREICEGKCRNNVDQNVNAILQIMRPKTYIQMYVFH